MDEIIKRSIDLGLAVYRVTEKFPEEEVLRQKLRAISIDFIEALCCYRGNPTPEGRFFNYSEIDQNIEKFRALAGLAKMQGWVNPMNFDVLADEYVKLFAVFRLAGRSEANHRNPSSAPEQAGPSPVPEPRTQKDLKAPPKALKVLLTERQEEIVGVLRKAKKPVKVTELAKRMRISKKTVERNIKGLLDSGAVVKHGNTRNAKFAAK